MKRKFSFLVAALSLALGLVLVVGVLAVASQASLEGYPTVKDWANFGGFEWADQVGGTATSVVVSNTYAYQTQGRMLLVYDVSNPAQPKKVGELNLLRSEPQDIGILGHYVFLAEPGEYDEMGGPTGGGIRVVDISNPSTPREVAFTTYDGQYYRRLVIAGHYLYLGDLWSSFDSGFRIFDIQNPVSPKAIGLQTIVSGLNTFDVFQPSAGAFAGKTLLLAGKEYEPETGLTIFDVTDPTQVQQIGIYSTIGDVHEIKALGTTAYLVDDQTFTILDLTDPTAPFLKGSLLLGNETGLISSIHLKGNSAFLMGGTTLTVVNFADPAHPAIVASLDTGHSPWDAVLALFDQENFIVSSAGNFGLELIKVTDPLHPVLVGQVESAADTQQVIRHGNYAFTSGDFLRAFDVSNPQLIKLLHTSSFTGSLEVIDNDIAYLSQGRTWVNGERFGGGLQLVDISNPTNPVKAGHHPQLFSGMDVLQPYAYLLAFGKLQVIDVSNPYELQVTAVYSTNVGNYNEIVVRAPAGKPNKRYAYITFPENGKMQVLDVTNPQKIEVVGTYTGHNAGFSVGRYMPVAITSNSQGKQYALLGVGSYTELVDITNPLSMTFINMTEDHSNIREIEIYGEDVYVSTDGQGLHRYMLADNPARLRYTGGYYLGQRVVLDTAASEGFVLETAGPGGLFNLWNGWAASTGVKVFTDTYTFNFPWGIAIFPNGVFTEPLHFHMHARYAGNMPVPMQMMGVDRFFEMEAYNWLGGDEYEYYQPVQPYTLTVTYDDVNLGGMNEADLALYYWNGSQWVVEPTSIVNSETNQVTATPSRLGLWGVMGPRDVSPIYLPFVQR